MVAVKVRQASQRHFEAGKQGTCIHIVLHQGIGHDDIAHGNAAIASTCHTREQDVGNTVLFHKQGCCHCTGNLADTR
jgi:hypothetical protein